MPGVSVSELMKQQPRRVLRPLGAKSATLGRLVQRGWVPRVLLRPDKPEVIPAGSLGALFH